MADTAAAPAFDPAKPFTPVNAAAKEAPKFDPDKPYKTENLPMTPESTGFAAHGKPIQRITSEVAEKLGYAPDVDYNTGIPFMHQSVFAKADNPDEQAAVLEYLYGKGNYGQDKGGRWWVKVGDKKLSVNAAYSLNTVGADMLGTAPVTVGAIGGGLAGSEMGPGGSVVGAGAGAAFGKAVDELYKQAIGARKKTAGQEAGTLAKVGVENAAFQAGGELIGTGAGAIAPAIRRFVGGATPQGQAMTRSLLAKGARPPIASAAPKSKVFQYDQMLRNLLRGNPQEARNVQYIQNEIKQMLKSEGLDETAINSMMSELDDTSAAISSTSAGKAVVHDVSQYHGRLEGNANAAMADAQAEIGKTDKLVKALAKTAPDDLGSTVANDIVTSRRQFGQRMNAVYDQIDAMTGGAPVIPTYLVKRAIAPIVKSLPPERLPTIFKEITELPNAISIKQMQRYRTRLRELADGGITPDIDNHLMGEAASAADHSFDKSMFANPPETRAILNELKKAGFEIPSERAVALLRKADAMYADGIAKYKDAAMQSIVKQARAGTPLDPRLVADLIAQPGKEKGAETILSILPPQTKRDVAAAFTQSLLKDAARTTGETGAKEITGDALLNELTKRGNLPSLVYDPVFGKGFTGRVTEYAKQLAAIDGKISVEALASGDPANAIRNALEQTKALDDFMSKNYLAALTKGGPPQIDRAMRFIVQPGNEAKLEAALNQLGPDAVAQVRQYALKSLLSKAMVELPSRTRTIGGSGIDDALSKFTPKQQELLFPDGLLDDLKNVAKEARFLFPWDTAEGGQDFGGSLAAAQIKAHVPFGIRADLAYIKRSFFGWLADRPTTIRLLSAGFEKGGPSAMYAGQALKLLSRSFLNSMASDQPGGMPAPQQGLPTGIGRGPRPQ